MFANIIFPFAPGVKYKVLDNLIIPKIDNVSWSRLFSKENIAIICYGGYLESVLSMTIGESFNKLKSGSNIYWIGNHKYSGIINANGIMKYKTFGIKTNMFRRYPAPAFCSNDFTFINSLYCYIHNIDVKCKEYKRTNYGAATFQIFRNSLNSWNESYFPKLRKNIPDSFVKQAKLFKFDLQSPFVLLAPDGLGLGESSLQFKWTPNEVRSFGSMLQGTKYKLVLITKNPNRYHGMSAFVPTFDYTELTYLASMADWVISADADIGVVATLFEKAKVVYKPKKDHLCIEKNAKWTNSRSELIGMSDITPYGVFEAIYG